MGIKLADYMDENDFDIHSSEEGILPLIIYGLEDVVDEETFNKKLETYKKQHQEYLSQRSKLYTEAYEQISLLIYQTDERKLFTEAECLNHIRTIKQEIKQKRNQLEEECFTDPIVEGES